MRRRDFITLLSGAAAAFPRPLRAQWGEQMRRIGVLIPIPENNPIRQSFVETFGKELQKLGWSEGRNIRIDILSGDANDLQSLRRSRDEVLDLQPDLILSLSNRATLIFLERTHNIPMIFLDVPDPDGKMVANWPPRFNNVTGFISIEPTMAGKWLEVLKKIAPRVTRVALLFGPATTRYAEHWLSSLKAAARSFRMEASELHIRDPSELESVIAPQASEPNRGLIVMPDFFLQISSAEVISLAARYRLAAVYPSRDFTELGGLLSYETDFVDQYRRAAIYADRILKGAKPSELPIQIPVKFEFVINLKTAKALGLKVPPTLLARANKVIK
jgi:putative ABC transport system substrate-binding protein